MSVLVFNPYFEKNNLGDQLFQLAFPKVFSKLKFTFVNKLDAAQVATSEAVFLGGGSFLDGKLSLNTNTLDALKRAKLFYIGVGTETAINPVHQELMGSAKLIASRTPGSTYVIPDLVYALAKEPEPRLTPKNPKVLILPNYSVVPNNQEGWWKHAAWNYFKSEFTQFLDYLVMNKYQIDIASMCRNSLINDDWAGAELIGQMVHRNFYNVELSTEILELINQISEYQIVITQRYHGSILAQLGRVPHLTLHHHDKLKSDYLNEGEYVPYYGIVKNDLIAKFHGLECKQLTPEINIDPKVWTELEARIYSCL